MECIGLAAHDRTLEAECKAMPLAKQAVISGGFGRRGGGAPGKTGAPSAPQRRPTVSPRPDQRAQDAIQDALGSAGAQVSTSAARGKAYAKALLAGTMTFIAALFFLTGVENRIFQAGPMLIILAIPILPTLGVILYIPTVLLSEIARLVSIPRGWADIGIGLILGSGLGLAVALTSPGEEAKSMMLALAMTAGGVMGGFAFWRAQGYPGTSSGSAAALDLTYEKVT